MSAEGGRAARILVIDDDDVVAGVVGTALASAGHAVQRAGSGEEGLRALDRELFDVVLLDLRLPRISGMDVLTVGRTLQTDAQFLMMTGHASVASAVEAMRAGAFDYLTKPIDIDELELVVERALRQSEMQRELARLQARDEQGALDRIIGRSAPMRRLGELIARVAATRATVLIVGETGTGKELVARAVHALSDRSRRPFIPIHCSAFPETLLEAELFGHTRGAFTGAVAARRGLFEEAAGGSLFLDEVATLSMPTQVKLLRVIQERTIQRLGGGPATHIDFRLIAAANVDLVDEVAAGRFREDLYYRLNVFPLVVPPLRERREDIPLLVDHFRTRFADEHGIDPPAVRAETLARMTAYDWPGNVRELENYVERALILHVGAETLPFEPPTAARSEPERELLATAARERWSLERIEREYVLQSLEQAGGNRSRAADMLGIDRRTLHRKLRSFGVESEQSRPAS